MKTIDKLIEVIRNSDAVANLIQSLNRNEAMDLTHEINAVRHYYAIRPLWYPTLNASDVTELSRVALQIEQRLSAGAFKPELSARGSQMERSKFPFGDTLEFALRFLNHPGWKLMHGECNYVGIWLNEERLELYTYTEGDVVLYKANNVSDLYGELLNFDIDCEMVA